MALPAGRYGVTKNQLLKIKKLPVNTIKLIEELTEKYDLLGTAAFKNSTSVVTQSTDLVESGAVYDVVGFGNKNLLPKFNNKVTLYGITYTPQDDGSVIANGTSENWATYAWLLNFPLKAGTYTLSGSPSASGTYISVVSGSDTYSSIDGSNVTFTLETDTVVDAIRLSVRPNATVNNVVFKPQLERGSVATSYEPHHASVEESLAEKCDNSVIGTVEGANASKAYAVGEHMIRGGKFCTVTVPVTTSSTWTLGGNYVEGTIADNLIKQDTFSGTTGADGNLKILDGIARHIVGVDAQGAIYIPFQTSTDTYLKVTAYDLTPKTTTAVSGTYYYI